MAAGIVVGGHVYPVDMVSADGAVSVPAVVLGPDDHGIEFKPGEGHNRRRDETIRAHAMHWTGAEREPEKMAETLKRRGYGVEFAIGSTGAIYQFADPLEVDTADVGGFNSPSVGTEVVCSGYRRPSRLWTLPAERPRYRGTVHGKTRTMVGFYPVQLTALAGLCDALNRSLGIPLRMPTDAAGRLLGGVMGPHMLRTYRGHLGHYHVSGRKLDPGPAPLQWLLDRWGDKNVPAMSGDDRGMLNV